MGSTKTTTMTRGRYRVAINRNYVVVQCFGSAVGGWFQIMRFADPGIASSALTGGAYSDDVAPLIHDAAKAHEAKRAAARQAVSA